MFRAGIAGASLLRLEELTLAEAPPAGCDLRLLGWHLSRAVAVGELLPRRRAVGPLTLDLVHRDACIGGGWLHLHPREFALLWRLADRPGARVTRGELCRDVWRLRHEPETNSVEVHVSRLRAKLSAAGCGSLIETDPLGGYRLAA
jgi:two-component system OmpR family response regulator